MIELPESRTIYKDLRKEILGKKIVDVRGNFTDHKFTFYYGNPDDYIKYINNKKITDIIDRNFYVEIEIEDYKLIFRDGANIRYYDNRQEFPEKSKLLLEFKDGSFINVTTSMYCCIAVFDKKKGMPDNTYYNYELNGIGALDKRFTLEYFKSLITDKTLKLSTKAFIATEQRILGIGNGVTQDILFNAKLNPKRKMNTLKDEEINNLYYSITDTINEMIKKDGRDTETNIYG